MRAISSVFLKHFCLSKKMEKATLDLSSKRIAVVTGANKGIGLEICRQLCSNGVFAVLTARDAGRGLAATSKLQASGVSDVVFHQLDISDSASIASFADYIKTSYGKLDILVNNAGISGVLALHGKLVEETYDLAKECIAVNYYGTKGITEALLPFLQLSQSPRIVNLSSFFGKLRCIPSRSIRAELSNVDSLTVERMDELVQSFLNDFKRGYLAQNGWSTNMSAYIVSKTTISAYTRLLARKYPNFCINCVHPGSVDTDGNFSGGILPVEAGAKGAVMLALLPDGSPSGLFFDQTRPSTYE